ncbi:MULTISPECIES: signal recognition particle protein Srp54 [Acidiplasma]|jgi:signal recognition particle subunit SRP54|uniref:Signal recognition particle 54 kDa protein n=2 Tax=Acidiplasma aeolicum TaxID=507754 RepID=A0A0N8VLA9_9ARCH|nr:MULTISPECIES: signal recognition particle protein Srp54 [Acidiplasma]KJE48691.1 signal recognition particle [Acidiplasma sp. MBA-1]KQB36012.1 signal recognition particle [Acidiplasma aeolicum]WMT55462.1 MAG: signal recognition particle protein Srp54 [Acidiplasma sp.]
MVLDSLSDSLKGIIRKISGSSYIDKDTIKEVSKEIQRALLKADVNVKLVLRLTKTLEDRAMNEKPPAGMTDQDYIIKIIYDELLKILGQNVNFELRPQTIMLVGLYGNGKTTTAGKLARFFIKKGFSTALIAADVHRPGAYEQLYQIAKEVNAQFYGEKDEKNALKIVKNGLNATDAKIKIIDTSGRDSLDEDLIKEVREIKESVKPDNVLFVLDATMGQQAGPQAKTLNDAVSISGVIITKMDGTGKGGGALSAVAEINSPVYFIGTGEHMDDIEIFNPKKFLSRLLGMGDIDALMEAVKETNFTEEEAEESLEKLMSGKFNLKDMYDVWEKFSKPGLLKKIFGSLPLAAMPGGDKINENQIDEANEKLQLYRVILDSMTYEELENPDILNPKRIRRIGIGSGKGENNVRALLKEYRAMKNNMKMIKGNRNFKKMLKASIKSGNFSLDDIN